ncbi:CLUMA_CG016544, isoform A [Clunio marinus]|uniref:CLUMA_CG016544, isoform A n=1 Tax=Clunio marinus TaxID=568069 RepID=A0A1J1IX15_9DIPT|nr:CLUMA_CG016544, isoform A [Clunio marinus]
MRLTTNNLCNKITLNTIKCILQCWIVLLIAGCPSHNNGLSSFLNTKNDEMLRKNEFLLMPHVPNRDDYSNKSNTSSNVPPGYNETSEPSDLNLNTQNHNFLMENHNNQNNIVMINENDESYFEIFKTPMKFGTDNNTKVTAQIGTTAHLPCTIHNIGEGVVSWIRRKDYHLLTVGLTTYSSDERFSATHLKNSEVR